MVATDQRSSTSWTHQCDLHPEPWSVSVLFVLGSRCRASCESLDRRRDRVGAARKATATDALLSAASRLRLSTFARFTILPVSPKSMLWRDGDRCRRSNRCDRSSWFPSMDWFPPIDRAFQPSSFATRLAPSSHWAVRRNADAGESEAFAVADHQLAHVYVRDRQSSTKSQACSNHCPGWPRGRSWRS